MIYRLTGFLLSFEVFASKIFKTDLTAFFQL